MVNDSAFYLMAHNILWFV